MCSRWVQLKTGTPTHLVHLSTENVNKMSLLGKSILRLSSLNSFNWRHLINMHVCGKIMYHLNFSDTDVTKFNSGFRKSGCLNHSDASAVHGLFI